MGRDGIMRGLVLSSTIWSHACAATEGPASRMLLRVDVPASLEVDGRNLGPLAPGTPRAVSLAPGRHRLALISTGGELRWEETLTVKATPVVRIVSLARAVGQFRQDYVRIPAGTFAMGCVESDTQCAADEKPRRQVTINRDFWMARTEATVRAYEAFVNATGREMPPAPRFNG